MGNCLNMLQLTQSLSKRELRQIQIYAVMLYISNGQDKPAIFLDNKIQLITI